MTGWIGLIGFFAVGLAEKANLHPIGVAISDKRTVIADRTNINASERVFRVRINLESAAYYCNKIYRPVLASDIRRVVSHNQ